MVLVIGIFWVLDIRNGTANNAEYATGVGTILLAFVTQDLVFNEIDEGKKNRRRDRIRDQLEGLYSPAMAWIDKFAITEEHFTKAESHKIKGSSKNDPKTYTWQMIQDIRSKFEFLAEPILKEQFRQYYEAREHPPYDEKGGQIYEKEIEFRKILENIQNLIKEDYKKLSDEYSGLVNISKTESKLNNIKPQQVKEKNELKKSDSEKQLQFDLAVFQSIEQISMSSDIALFVLGATFIIASYQVSTVILGVKISDILLLGGFIISLYSFFSLTHYLVKVRKKNIQKIALDHNLKYDA
jgi:hypothetical protein